LEEEHTVPLPSTTGGVGEAARKLSRISAGLKKSESAINAAADGRATIPSLLRRLVKKCKQYPHLKQQLRSWWESAQDLLSEEADAARLLNNPSLGRRDRDGGEQTTNVDKTESPSKVFMCGVSNQK